MAFFDRFKRKAAHPEHKPAAKKAASAVLKDKAEALSDRQAGKSAAAKIEPPVDSTAYRVLVRPIVSEKTSRLEAGRQYVFAVSPKANKVEIKKAVEGHYRVHVTKVNVINYAGKKVRYGRTLGERRDWRKAYVTLKAGESIVF
jgi:large subunit ribosomal protein L23